MNHLPRTDIQRRLDDDFDAMFGRGLPLSTSSVA